MPLSPKEKDQIIEEETLRFETRKNLQAQSCAQHRGHGWGRWLWYLAFFILGLAAHGLMRHCCPWQRVCPWEGQGMQPGHHCMMGSDMGPGGDDKAPVLTPTQK